MLTLTFTGDEISAWKRYPLNARIDSLHRVFARSITKSTQTLVITGLTEEEWRERIELAIWTKAAGFAQAGGDKQAFLDEEWGRAHAYVRVLFAEAKAA